VAGGAGNPASNANLFAGSGLSGYINITW
jgi:hypothetical protein